MKDIIFLPACLNSKVPSLMLPHNSLFCCLSQKTWLSSNTEGKTASPFEVRYTLLRSVNRETLILSKGRSREDL